MKLLHMLSSLIVLPAAVHAEPVAELDPSLEVQMALSAAPEHLRGKAGVYRLDKGGYSQVRPSQNGFNCLVAREPSEGLAPLCYDREGSETNMKADIFRGMLRRQGKSSDEIDRLVLEEYKAGRLIAPRKPGIAYMLSSNFTQVSKKTGKRQCIFPPHVMFYAPYLTNADIGAEQGHRGSTTQPWVLNEGEANAHILVVSHGVDIKACE